MQRPYVYHTSVLKLNMKTTAGTDGPKSRGRGDCITNIWII